jgi:hypothetical protein
MWCPKCEVDVATEVSTDGQALLCTSCGSEVKKVVAPSLHPEMRRARDLLARLAAESAAAPAESPPEASPTAPLATAAATEPNPSSAEQRTSDRQFRIDRSHPTADVAHGHVSPTPPAKREAAAGTQRRRRDDDSHVAIPAPHFEVTLPPSRLPGKSESVWGQLLAYGGVAVLTIGTALVLLGYFGGQPAYAPTGWLVATAGQMLLFLGVITLVSGGMQQTTHEVSTRVAHLDGRMIRIEQTAEQLLNGPHFGRERAAKPSAKAASDGEDAQPV